MTGVQTCALPISVACEESGCFGVASPEVAEALAEPAVALGVAGGGAVEPQPEMSRVIAGNAIACSAIACHVSRCVLKRRSPVACRFKTQPDVEGRCEAYGIGGHGMRASFIVVQNHGAKTMVQRWKTGFGKSCLGLILARRPVGCHAGEVDARAVAGRCLMPAAVCVVRNGAPRYTFQPAFGKIGRAHV